jgi:hypothetical protein
MVNRTRPLQKRKERGTPILREARLRLASLRTLAQYQTIQLHPEYPIEALLG